MANRYTQNKQPPRPGKDRTPNSAGRSVQPGERPKPLYPQARQPGVPRHPQRGPQRRPVPNAEAARRAAMSSMQSGRSQSHGPAGQDPYKNPENTYQQPLHSDFSPDYLDDLLQEGDYTPERSMPKPLKLALFVAGAIILLLLIFLIVRAVSQRGSGDVKLERRTQEKRGVIATTAERSTAATRPKETEAEATLPPVGTDPYDNAPAWTPPTQAKTTSAPTPPQAEAPPPVVNVQSEEPLPPAAEDVTPEIPLPPGDVEINLPAEEELGPAEQGGEQVQVGEEQILDLPQSQSWEVVAAPAKAAGRVINAKNAALFMWPNINGQYELAQLPGSYEKIYASADNSRIVTEDSDGIYRLHRPGYEPIQLPIAAVYGLEKLVGNQGLAYISAGVLYYMPYDSLEMKVISPQTSSALLASDVAEFLVVADDSVRIMSDNGMIKKELMPKYTSQGSLQLDVFTEDGKLAVFQDDLTSFVYLPDFLGDNVLRIDKDVPGVKGSVQYSSEGNEILITQPGSHDLVRVREGRVEHIKHPDWNFDAHSFFLEAGDSNSGDYAALAIYSNDKLYLSNSSSYFQDANNSYYQASLLYSGIEEVFTAGYGVYWTDHEGKLYSIDSRSDVNADDFSVKIIGEGGISKISANVDGSSIFYLKNATLWRRSAGNAAEALAMNVADYITNPDGSKIYIITTEGGLQAYTAGNLSELAPNGSGITRDSINMNPQSTRGGNTWIDTARIVYLLGNQILSE